MEWLVLNIPLSVVPVVKYGKEHLNIWQNGKNKVIQAPIKPYFYANERKSNIPAIITELNGISLSRYKKKTFYKYEFDTRKELVDSRELIESYESNIPFVLRNRIDIPDLYTKFPNTDDLKFLFIDVEQYTPPDRLFPTYDDRIVSIAFCTNDRKIKCIYLKKDNMSDKKLLIKFIEEYQKINPDVLVVYNKSYDIPTILYRCAKNRIDITKFSKTSDKPYVLGKDEMNIEGVVIYDVLLSARADQSLTGNVINRGLKAVSDHFGFKAENPPLTAREISEFIGTEKLVSYNKDDISRLLLVFDVYWPNVEFNANDLKIPLNIAIDLNITDLGLIVIGDEFKKHNIIADGTNYQRYPEIFQRKRSMDEYEGSNYEGALVGIDRTGLFEPIYKADYSSMYPSIVASFNLSPDTTTLLDYRPLGDFRIEETSEWFEYHIPDRVLGKNMVIQVSKQRSGFCAELVKKFLKERAEYKRLDKQTGDRRYRAMSDNRKVKANGGVYGIQGSPNHAFGFAPIGIATTGIGRESAKLLIGVLNELYPNSVTEFDTDGVYFTTNSFNQEKIITLFNQKLREKFKKDLQLTIDIDSYDGGYFYKIKNYVLRKGEKIIYHGAALKATSKDLLSKNLIQELAKAKLTRQPVDKIIKKYQSLDFPLEYFAMNVTLGMGMKQYKNINALAPRLAKQAEKHFGVKPEVGMQLYYIKTTNDYKLLELSKKEEIDTSYYRGEIDRAISMFDIEPAYQTIDKWI